MPCAGDPYLSQRFVRCPTSEHPVSALSDVHQGGLRAVSLYKVSEQRRRCRSQASRGGSLLSPGVGFPDIRVFHQSQPGYLKCQVLTLSMPANAAILCNFVLLAVNAGRQKRITFCIQKGLGVAYHVNITAWARQYIFNMYKALASCPLSADLSASS